MIYNRLQKDVPLGIDSSIIYASKLAGRWKNDGKVYKSDLDRRSPYNTRLHTGLPPGPIASPGASALQAALDPAQTDYLYYVREPSRNEIESERPGGSSRTPEKSVPSEKMFWNVKYSSR